MVDVRRIVVIFVIAILFTILVNVSIEAVKPKPEYNDYCNEKFAQPAIRQETCPEILPTKAMLDSCEGRINYHYDSHGCPAEAFCDSCSINYDAAQARYNLVVFIVSAITGLIALIIGLYLPHKKNPINEWVGSGFLLAGLLTILIGTARYFDDMGRYTRPVIIFIELVLFIYLTYKKLGSKRKPKNKK
jgi:hypothetical protein